MKLYCWNHRDTCGYGQYQIQNNYPKLLLLGVLPWGWATMVFGHDAIKAIRKAKYESPVLLEAELIVHQDSTAQREKLRPPNYNSFTPDEKAKVDKGLGLTKKGEK